MIPALLDAILLGVLAEALALLAYRRYTGNGVAPRALLANLAAGGSLMLALRCAVQAMAPEPRLLAVLAALLLLAGVAHIADLAVRWERKGAAIGAPAAR